MVYATEVTKHRKGNHFGLLWPHRLLTIRRRGSIFLFVNMQHKSPHEKSASAKLTFLVLSDAEKPSRSFKASKFQLAIIVLFGVVAIGGVSIFAMIYTPLGELILPSYFSTQAEQLQKVRVLETKVDAVQSQLTYLAAYNLKLREALGDTGEFDTNSSPGQQPAAFGTVVQSVPGPPEESALGSTTPEQMPTGINVNFASERGVAGSIFPLAMPVQGFVTRGVNYATQHYGIDISAQEGEPIVAPAPGEVVFSDWTLTGGNTLMIAHPGNFMTIYKHCERILVPVGAKVSRGEAIALVGSTGTTSTGPHLHFELWHDGKNLNPENYLLTKN